MREILEKLLNPVESLEEALEMRANMIEFADKCDQYSYSTFTGEMISLTEYLKNFRQYQIAVDGPFAAYNGALHRLIQTIKEMITSEGTFIYGVQMAISLDWNIKWKLFFKLEKDDFDRRVKAAIKQFDEIAIYDTIETRKKYLKLQEDDEHVFIIGETIRDPWNYIYKDGDEAVVLSIEFINFQVVSSTTRYHKTEKEEYKKEAISLMFPEMLL